MSSPWQQGVGHKISSKMDGGWESNFLPSIDNALSLSPCQNKYTSDLNLGRYRGSKFQNLPFYLHFLADTSSVKFVYTLFHICWTPFNFNLGNLKEKIFKIAGWPKHVFVKSKICCHGTAGCSVFSIKSAVI